jgi:predicted kinase
VSVKRRVERVSEAKAVLHLFCGKIASGKSSLASELAKSPRSVLLSEDQLLSRLYPGEIKTLEDYVRSIARLREAIGPHLQALLRGGMNVVLDFQANTPRARAWIRSVIDGAGADHQLHYLLASDEVCKRRLGTRNAMGTHEYQVTEAEFELFTSHFVAPSPEEGFNVVVHAQQ